jgi:hypothetical protein
MNGAERIAAERERQIQQEGWTSDHDDEHVHGELARAAACYVQHAGRDWGEPPHHTPYGWPWDGQWWKPTGDAICDLTKAGALIAAEIDRELRGRGQ